MLRSLTPEEMDEYRRPFRAPGEGRVISPPPDGTEPDDEPVYGSTLHSASRAPAQALSEGVA